MKRTKPEGGNQHLIRHKVGFDNEVAEKCTNGNCQTAKTDTTKFLIKNVNSDNGKYNMTDQEEILQKQYDRLIGARNFHYNNLNKWLITFYAIIGALFVALQALHCGEQPHRYLELCVAVVGYIASIAAWLSGKGYYYWETNWIMLIQNFEKRYLVGLNDDCRVYSVFANCKVNNDINSLTKGANISTSKVALVITAFIAYLWGMIAVYLLINLIPQSVWEPEMCCKIVIPCMASFALTQLLLCSCAQWLKSDMNFLDDLKL